jgi:hypothetical protein
LEFDDTDTHIALIRFTGGTTDRAKCAAYSLSNLWTWGMNPSHYIHTLPFPSPRGMFFSPINHAASGSLIIPIFIKGGTILTLNVADAEDVLYSINHHRKEDSKSAAKALLKTATELKAEDKYTIKFTLDVGSADFPYLMNDYHMTIFPAGTTDFNDGMGTGPFVMENFEPGVSCAAKRNPNYFKEGKPYFDAIKVIHIPDGYWNDVWKKKPWCAVYWEFDGGKFSERWWFKS